MVKLTATQKKREAAKKQQYYQQQRLLEDEADKAERLGKRRKRQSNLPEDARAETRADAKARMATLRANQSAETRGKSLERDRLWRTQARVNQSAETRAIVNEQNRVQTALTRASQPAETRSMRLARDRLFHTRARVNHTAKTRALINEQNRIRTARALENETPEEHAARLQRQRDARQNETPEKHAARLQRQRDARQNETPEEHEARLQLQRDARQNETPEQHQARLQRQREARAERAANVATYRDFINTFSDISCEVCEKQCYPNQVRIFKVVAGTKPYLPPELANNVQLVVCHRCHKHLSSKKAFAPPKAYWNNMRPGVIPNEIAVLTEPERRLLQRIIPYVKVIKYPGRFGQYGFKGHAVLFALDIFEVSEAIPQMLPRPSTDVGMVVITENMADLNITKEYEIMPERVYAVLDWLITHNPLYKDVIVDQNVRLETQDVIRVIPEEQQQPEEAEQANPLQSAYVTINDSSRILRASFQQGDIRVFESEYCGRQCLAMVTANVIRAEILPPSLWDTNVLNKNMYAADALCSEIHHYTMHMSGVHPVDENGYLEIKNLDIVKNDILMFNNSFAVEYSDIHGTWAGALKDAECIQNVHTLHHALEELFANYKSGVLVAFGYSFGFMHYEEKYYYTDSHSCGPKGTGGASNGKACIIECDTLDELMRIARRTIKQTAQTPFLLHGLNLTVKNDMIALEEYQRIHPERQIIDLTATQTQHEPEAGFIPVQTSVMANIDYCEPLMEDVLEANQNVNEIVRKTKDNIVNVNHEKKAEEFAWFHLFPHGVNGLNEQRDVPITPLDYFQQRILGKDTRFQSTNYLFYALSMFEFHRAQATINAFAKKNQGQHGAVEDVHLHLRNLRGTAAYWRQAHLDLISMIRSLGPPTWFITLSCNDLNWLDMRKALLVADGRPDVDPSTLTPDETQRLIELYPVVISRHFNRRVEAFMKLIYADVTLLGGKVIDHFYRVEIQSRGSPHIHLVVWIENAPSFETPEGIALIDQIISCYLPTEEDDPELYSLVKRNQIHRHSFTCFKNNSATCRFAFPRQACTETHIVSPHSNEFIRNGGRMCILKRRLCEKFVNNYNLRILEFWDGNMDIQACGTNEAIARYLAKYISKGEPTDLDQGVAQAIREIRREESNISRKMFKICMRIMRERQVSAPECVYRLCHLPMRSSSRNVIFLNTRLPEQRYHMLRFEGNQAVALCKNAFSRYELRPQEIVHGLDFPNMCLYEFATLTEPDYKKKDDDEIEGDLDAPDEIQQPQDGRIFYLIDRSKMRIRRVPQVVRVPRFNMQLDPNNYYYSHLVQYTPFTSERELLEDYDSPREAFLAREQHLRATCAYLDLYRERDNALELAFNQAHAFNLLDHPEVLAEEEFEEEPINQGMDDEMFQQVRSAMNVQQRDLLNTIITSIQAQQLGNEERLHLFITGGAGTGKTFTLKAAVEHINRCYAKQAVKICALTGVAARLVNGMTIHSLFRLPVERDGKVASTIPLLTGNYLRVIREQWRDVEFLVIDEISMVSYQLLNSINSRCYQLKNNELPFGGLNVLLFGDLMQLPPIQPGYPVYKQPVRYQPATHWWGLFSLVELTQNMRQQGDTTFADLLNALRVGKLRAPHFTILTDKLLTEATGDFDINKAIRIYPTNAQVDEHNTAVLEQYRKAGVDIYKVKAQDALINQTRNRNDVQIETLVPKKIDKTGGLPTEIEIFEGARVMLRSNIDVKKGLVNGAIGTITKIDWGFGMRGQLHPDHMPRHVEIDFGRNGVHNIEPRIVEFPSLRDYGDIQRRQLPLVLCFACTVHKMQGSTVDCAVVHLGKKLFADGQAYVALSRVRSLDGLRIEELDCTKLAGTIPCNNEAIEIMEKMRRYQPFSQI